MKIANEQCDSPFLRILAGLVEGKDVTNFSVDFNTKQIQILVGEWCLELNNDGTWEVH